MIIVDQAQADAVAKSLEAQNETFYRIGEVTEGDGHVIIK